MANKPAAHALGDVYLFIHQRAQFIRQQKAAAASTDSEAHDTATAHSTSAQKQAQPGVYTNGKK